VLCILTEVLINEYRIVSYRTQLYVKSRKRFAWVRFSNISDWYLCARFCTKKH